MKILFVGHFYYYFGGAESVFINEMDFLSKLGHEILFFGVNNDKNIDIPYEHYFLDKDNISKKIENNQKLSIIDKLSFIANSIENRVSADKFDTFIDKTRPDIIHFHKYSRYITPSLYKTVKKYNIPALSTQHDCKLACPTSFLMQESKRFCSKKLCIKGNYLYSLRYKCNSSSLLKTFNDFLELSVNKKKYLKYTDKIIVPSIYLKKILIESNIPENQIEYLPNFVDLNLFKYSESNGSYFLYFGRISYEKGLLTLIKAFQSLPDLSLKLVGCGAEKKSLEKFVADNNLVNIEFLGSKTQQELAEIIKNSKAVILPSECGENAPLSILESFSCGKPVIGSNLGGISELVHENIDGYLFESANISNLIDKILVLNNKSDKELIKMGFNARKKAEEKFSLEKHCQNLQTLYLNALK